MNQTLLQVRNELKEKKPIFIRQDNPKRKKLNYKWRKPKGIHSKIRHHFKGRRKMPSPGYKSPRQIKNLHVSGLMMVRVFSIDDVKKINKETQGIVIAKNVGIKKKIGILKISKQMNIAVLNLNVDETIKKIEDFISSKSKKSETKKETAKEKEEKKQIGKKETKEKEHQMSDEERKESEKKEKDKILTKKV